MVEDKLEFYIVHLKNLLRLFFNKKIIAIMKHKLIIQWNKKLMELFKKKMKQIILILNKVIIKIK